MDMKEQLPDYLKVPAREMNFAKMQQDFAYRLAQKITEKLFVDGYISKREFDKISALNREKFSPFLPELLG